MENHYKWLKPTKLLVACSLPKPSLLGLGLSRYNNYKKYGLIYSMSFNTSKRKLHTTSEQRVVKKFSTNNKKYASLSYSPYNNISAINIFQLFGCLLCTVWTSIVNNYYFIIMPTIKTMKGSFKLILQKGDQTKWTPKEEIESLNCYVSYHSEKAFTINQTIKGRFSRSLYVGNKMEYLSLLSAMLNFTWQEEPLFSKERRR